MPPLLPVPVFVSAAFWTTSSSSGAIESWGVRNLDEASPRHLGENDCLVTLSMLQRKKVIYNRDLELLRDFHLPGAFDRVKDRSFQVECKPRPFFQAIPPVKSRRPVIGRPASRVVLWCVSRTVPFARNVQVVC